MASASRPRIRISLAECRTEPQTGPGRMGGVLLRVFLFFSGAQIEDGRAGCFDLGSFLLCWKFIRKSTIKNTLRTWVFQLDSIATMGRKAVER